MDKMENMEKMKVAVYGTLRTDIGHRFMRSGIMSDFADPVGPCLIPGLLYDVGTFPGLVPGDGKVRGQLWEVVPGLEGGVLYVLDKIESYYERNEFESMYLRRKTRLIEPKVDAFAYFWNYGTRGMELIENGDWEERATADLVRLDKFLSEKKAS